MSDRYDVHLLFEDTLLAESDLIRLRARLTAVAMRLGFAPALIERARLAASEIVSNQMKYAGGRGLLQVWEASLGNQRALDLFALDYGPGIGDPPAALVDGYSTHATLGKGLGAIGRAAHAFGLLTRTAPCEDLPWHGTALWVRFAPDARRPSPWDIGLYRRSYQGARANGDGFALCVGHGLRVLHLDVLGHGSAAGQVADRAQYLFDCRRPLTQAFAAIEEGACATRGAAALSYECDDRGRLSWVGVGDMQAQLLHEGGQQSLRFRPGILGQAHGRLQVAETEWPVGGLVASASDGLRRQWGRALARIAHHPPQLVAYFLGQVLGRVTDDRSCLVVRRLG